MAVIALIAVGLTQNKPLPENVKVTQICVSVFMRRSGGVEGKGSYGKSEHTGRFEALAAQEQASIHWIKGVKWKWILILEEGMSGFN